MKSALSLWTTFVLALASAAAHAADAYRIDYRQSTLGNGMKVVSAEDFSSPIIAVQVWYHVGSKDENPERQGFAHMFEHMMFRGTDRLGSTDHFDLIHRTGGDCNAYTSFDQTVYIQELPAHQLEMVLWLEAERMTFLNVSQKNFDTERKIVEEERRLGLNRPFGDLPEKTLPEIFPNHPYRWTPIGKIPHLRAAEVKELRDFWNRYYVPNNATLVVVGAAKHDDVKRLAEMYFGWVPRSANPPRVAPPQPFKTPGRKIVVKPDNAPVSIVGTGFRIVPENHPDYALLSMLASILGGGEGSRLYRELVAEKQIAVAALAQEFALESEGLLGAIAVIGPTGSSEPAEAAISRHIDRLTKEPVSGKELEKARNHMLVNMANQRQTVAGKARLLGSAAVLLGDVEEVNRTLPRVQQVTEVDLFRVARKYLTPERRIDVRVDRNLLGSLFGGKKNAEENAPITAKPETVAPKPGRPGAVRPADFPTKAPVAAAPKFEQKPLPTPKILSNGMKLFTITNREVPLVVVQLGFRTGAAVEDKPGSASLAMQMLTKGTSRRTEAQISAEIDDYGLAVEGSAGTDSASVVAVSLPQHLPRAVGLLTEVVRLPSFPEAEFKKLRTQLRTNFAVTEREPATIAEKAFRKTLYGDHPYARNAEGESSDLDKLTPADCKAWYQRWATPDNAALIFSGDVDEATAVKLGELAFGNWKPAAENRAVAKTPVGSMDAKAWEKIDPKSMPEAKSTTIYLVDKPGAIQSQIRIGARVPLTRQDPRHNIASVVGNYFGGAFGSRLNDTVRVKLGLTYGARGGYRIQRTSGDFYTSTFSKTATTAKTVEAVLGEVKRLLQEQPSETELANTKSNALGKLPAETETARQLAGQVWLVESYGLPDDYFMQRTKSISGVDYQACLRFAAETVDPSKLVIVVVGDAKQIRKDLEKIAPVVTVGGK